MKKVKEIKTYNLRVTFTNFDKRKCYGYTNFNIKKGDCLNVKMESGRTFIFEFKKIDFMRDPSDMFFAKLKDIGYAD